MTNGRLTSAQDQAVAATARSAAGSRRRASPARPPQPSGKRHGGHGVKLEPNLVVAARQAAPFDGVLAFLDVPPCRCAVMAKRHHPFGRPRQVGDDEANARIRFARMPFDPDHHAAALRPACGLAAEVCVIPAHVVRWSANGALEQMRDADLQHLVGGKPDRVSEALGFQEPMDVRRGENGIASKVAPQPAIPIAGTTGSRSPYWLNTNSR